MQFAKLIPLGWLLWLTTGATVSGADWPVLGRMQLGEAPRQICFSSDGTMAYVAMSGSGHVAIVDVQSLQEVGQVPAPGKPVGVLVLPGGHELAISHLDEQRLSRHTLGASKPASEYALGKRPSLLSPVLADGSFLVAAEDANQLLVVDAKSLQTRTQYPTGDCPSSPAVTSDGRLAFVSGFVAGVVTTIDLFNQRVIATTPVGKEPAGAAVLPTDCEVAVALRAEGAVVLLNTVMRQVVHRIEDVGLKPLGVTAHPELTVAVVNNEESHDLALVSLATREVVGRVQTGEVPIFVAVHPSAETLWVACEGSHEVWVFGIPKSVRRTLPVAESPTRVGVLGMTHRNHLTSKNWGLAQVRETVERFRPDALLVELPPDRWERIRTDFFEREAFEDSRVKVFPEYVDCLLHVARDLGIEVVPCAAWTTEMNELRRERIRQFNTDERWKQQKEAYDARRKAVSESLPEAPKDDPHYIHSDAYDTAVRRQLEPYNAFLNDWIGPGGWANINRAHMAWVHRAIDERPGKRLLVTFGAGHKYWFLDELRQRTDVEVVDVRPYLPSQETSMNLTERCQAEVVRLHEFFEVWFNGSLANTDEAFAAFDGVLAPEFEIITPGGTKIARAALTEALRTRHGAHRETPIKIWIEKVQARSMGKDLITCTYEEWQESGGETRGRLSTVLLREQGDAFEWLHVHETWLPTK